MKQVNKLPSIAQAITAALNTHALLGNAARWHQRANVASPESKRRREALRDHERELAAGQLKPLGIEVAFDGPQCFFLVDGIATASLPEAIGLRCALVPVGEAAVTTAMPEAALLWRIAAEIKVQREGGSIVPEWLEAIEEQIHAVIEAAAVESTGATEEQEERG